VYIDAHTHLWFREAINPTIAASMARESGLNPEFVSGNMPSPRDVVRLLDEAEIDYVGIMAYPSRKLWGTTEEFPIRMIRVCREYPDRFAIIGGVEVNELSIEETRYWLGKQYDAGVSGFKLHPPHMWVKPNAYRQEEGGLRQLELLYQFAEDHGLPVFIHTGTSSFSRARNKYADPILVDDASIDFPRLRIVMAHAGRPNWVNTAFQLVRIRSNLYVDLSSIPPRRVLDYIPRLAQISNKALYGSDYPGPGVRDIKENLAEFLKLPLPGEAIRDITSTVPKSILRPLSGTR